MGEFAYLPHTESEIRSMLNVVGVDSIGELFADIPDSLRIDGLDLPDGISESEVTARFSAASDGNLAGVSFLGGGCYDHLIPAAVDHIAGRSEFVTAYTPYQAEISQGILQAMFEFQTMMSRLTDLPVPNASLYDGATAAAEACAMSVNATKGRRIALSESVHPHTRAVVSTFFAHQDVEVVEIPAPGGTTDLEELARVVREGCAAVLLQNPNWYGIVENFTGVADLAHRDDALLIISSNPLSLGILKSQGEWGADIGVGDAQPFGLRQFFGGPSVGYIVSTERLMRRMPGRIVGETVDTDGRRAFVLTLQAREQHIKRERATSNICTNQALAALTVAAYLAVVGRTGLVRIAERNLTNAHYLHDRLLDLKGVESLEGRFFNEFVLRLPCPVSKVHPRFLDAGYFPGIPLTRFGSTDNTLLLVAVTEKRTRGELDRYVQILEEALG